MECPQVSMQCCHDTGDDVLLSASGVELEGLELGMGSCPL